jgi:hypothetical protein
VGYRYSDVMSQIEPGKFFTLFATEVSSRGV